jgi:hypothetical protein
MPRPSIGSRIRKSRKKAGKSAPPLKTSLKRGSKQSPRAGQKYSRKAAPKKAAPKKAPAKPTKGQTEDDQVGDYGDAITAAYLAGQDIATAGVGGVPLPISPTATYSPKLLAPILPAGEAIQAPGGSLYANIQGTSAPPQAGAVTAVPVAAAPQPPAEVAMIPATDIGVNTENEKLKQLLFEATLEKLRRIFSKERQEG